MKRTAFWLCLVLALFLASGASGRRRKPKKGGKKLLSLVESFKQCIKSKDQQCRKQKLQELEAHAKRACPLLADELRQGTEEIQPALAGALVQLKCTQTLEVARELLASPDCEVRGLLAVEFAVTRDKNLVEPVGKLISTGRPYDKEKACAALAVMGHKEGVPALVRACGDSFFSVRLQAADSLGGFATTESREALCKLVEADANSGVRVKAAQSLELVKDINAVPCLTKALNDDVGMVKTAVHKALIATTGLDVGMSPEAWEKWWDRNKPRKRR